MKTLLPLIFVSILFSGFNRIDNHQPLTTNRLRLDPGGVIAQSFYSSRDGLNIVSVCLRSDHFLEPLEFTLHESTIDSMAIRSISFNVANIDNFDCTKLQFDEINNSKDKQYFAAITRVKSEEEFLDSKPIPIYAEANSRNDYKSGSAYYDGVELAYDLHFKTHYKQDPGDTLEEVISDFSTRIVSDLAFFLPYSIIIIFVLYKYLKPE